MRAGAAAVAGVGILLLAGACREPSPPPREVLPAVSPNQPGPGDPPVVWLSGTLEEVQDGHIAVREGQGPRISLQRLAHGATAFFRLDPGGWRQLAEDEVDLLEVGVDTCVEALLDGDTFLALRVFLGAGCGPSG